MKKITLNILLLALMFGTLKAQNTEVEVHWATKVISFSSELTSVQYSSDQILGKPNVLPAGGQNPNAWSPDKPSKKEFIKVGFDEPLNLRQIAIAESHNPGAIYRVFAYDENDKEFLIHTFNPRTIPLKSRFLNIFVEKTPYKVHAVKIELDGAAVPDYFSIDAIAISDSDIPIASEIQIHQWVQAGLVVEMLDANINSEYKEYKPLLSPDGKVMYFSRKNHPDNVGGVNDDEDIWISRLDSAGNWTKAENAGTVLNNAGPNFVCSVTPDGKTVVMLVGNSYLDNGEMEAGVSISTLKDGEWTKPQTLVIENDYNYDEKANYFLSNSRDILIMSVLRDDSRGGRDLYVCFVKEDGKWTEPLNLGTDINTAADEGAPFLAVNDKTLYFSTNGFPGYGGTDIYRSERLDDTWTKWTEPKNLGPDINTEHEDLFFNMPEEGNYAYFSREDENGENSDIFRVEYPIFVKPVPMIAVKGTLLDKSTGEPIAATIIAEELPSGNEIARTSSDPATGDYEFLIPAGKNYTIRAEKEGFLSDTKNLDLREYDENSAKIDHEDLKLSPIKKDEVIVLNNIFFDFDNASFKESSTPELERLAKILHDNTTMTIEVSGHTDGIGNNNYNLRLSKRRAQSVYNYLIGQSISKARLKINYFGENKPIATNDTPEGRKLNRRVEFKITSE